jgi:hypothetical protein
MLRSQFLHKSHKGNETGEWFIVISVYVYRSEFMGYKIYNHLEPIHQFILFVYYFSISNINSNVHVVV